MSFCLLIEILFGLPMVFVGEIKPPKGRVAVLNMHCCSALKVSQNNDNEPKRSLTKEAIKSVNSVSIKAGWH
jgi:hypothetical protein